MSRVVTEKRSLFSLTTRRPKVAIFPPEQMTDTRDFDQRSQVYAHWILAIMRAVARNRTATIRTVMIVLQFHLRAPVDLRGSRPSSVVLLSFTIA
jgi:hypothetical protein